MKFQKTIVKSIFISILLTSTVCYAELGEAPMPKKELKKATGPTMEETVQWIKKKMASLPPVKYRFLTDGTLNDTPADSKSEIVIEDCNFKMIKMSSQLNTRKACIPYTARNCGLLSIYLMPLLDVDKDSIAVIHHDWDKDNVYKVEVKSIGNRDVFYQGSMDYYNFEDRPYLSQLMENVQSRKSGYYTSSIRIEVSHDMETAQSIANALKHAAQLCQEKAAKEKALMPAKPKDLF